MNYLPWMWSLVVHLVSQDLSIAGKRAGLAGERSGLFMEQIRIVKEMRDADIRRGRTGQFVRPRFMVWENVVGAFSSNKGDDFRAVLEETIRVAEPDAPDIPLPAKGKWPLADCWMGDGWSVAYRVLDAQFWGVPQRRRRIALVADFGGHAVPEILFVRESVRRNIAESGTRGKEAAAGTGGDAEKTGVICLNDQGGSIMGTSVDVTATLRAEEHGHQPIICAGFKHKAGARTHGIGYEEERAPTLTSEHQVSVYDARGNGDGRTVCTLTGDHQDRVTDYTAIVMSTGQAKAEVLEEKSPTLNCNHEQPIVGTFQNTGQGWWNEGPVAATLRTPRGGDSVKANLVVAGFNPQARATAGSIGYGKELSPTIDTGSPHAVYSTIGAVRRLTPLECERLQGYPDGWTDIGPWTETTGKVHKESSDSARYKALGNSIALPPWAWLLKRLCGCYERTATMASLFDGIGGFPLIWERLNGPGSCLWASEIEEFPIAVTKKRFGTKRAGW